MASWRGVWAGGMTVVFLASTVAAVGARTGQNPKDKNAAQKIAPDPAAMAQAQEIQALVRTADTAMSGQSVPSDFAIQFQNDFIRAQGARVWVPMTFTIDPAKLT